MKCLIDWTRPRQRLLERQCIQVFRSKISSIQSTNLSSGQALKLGCRKLVLWIKEKRPTMRSNSTLKAFKKTSFRVTSGQNITRASWNFNIATRMERVKIRLSKTWGQANLPSSYRRTTFTKGIQVHCPQKSKEMATTASSKSSPFHKGCPKKHVQQGTASQTSQNQRFYQQLNTQTFMTGWTLAARYGTASNNQSPAQWLRSLSSTQRPGKIWTHRVIIKAVRTTRRSSSNSNETSKAEIIWEPRA